jgi:hypothetical protein
MTSRRPGERTVAWTSIRRVGPVLGALVVTGALAACSGGQPGAAAVVGDRAVATSDVETATRELAAVYGEGAPSSTVVLISLVQSPFVAAAAEDAGAAVSEQQARDGLAADAEAAGVPAGDFSAAAVDVVRTSLTVQALADSPAAAQAQAAIAEDLSAQDLRLNPRFGTVDADGAITTTDYPWLVAPTAPAP